MLENDRLADLFNGIEYFFDAVKAKCSSDEEYAAELLKARGFLLEDEGLILSDNSHPDDIKYLNSLLTKENIGEVKDGKIVIALGGNVEKIFYKDNQIGGEACTEGETWKKFIHNSFAPQIPVRWLEPFIARYVKAISACGVGTWCSCDGNHLDRRSSHRIIIDLTGMPNSIWHEIICNRLLYGRFKFRWGLSSDGAKIIRFIKKDKWIKYAELNRAGEFLYNNRIKIRQIRREASSGITNSMARHLSDDELAAIFSEKANKLFDEFLNDA